MALDAFSTILRPVVSEKSTVLGDQGKYIFEVAPTANKIQIKQAIEAAFANKKVQVSAVNIVHVTGKVRRRGRSVGMTRSWKKAIVTLKAGQRLDLFEGV
ncbi:MAG: 50S ribosomal protein L23 [Chloroflexi bacterium]|nr:50S ribosomal protein L23 [Chloroflexota bacterium]MBV9133027.1 50S ribosomal protein L23 [Chloroflexota bacterium]